MITERIEKMCPRCRVSLIPSNENWGLYVGAISRADNKTEICSACGEDEGLKDFFEGGCEPVSAWPI